MTDIHSHIIFDIDDGSKSIEESLEIINKLSSLGFNNIICTPHFIEGTEYSAYNKDKEKRLKVLQSKSKTNLYLGNEIYINTRIDEYIKKDMIMPINKNNLLIELPMRYELKDAFDILYELKIKGYNIILAHPERYQYCFDNLGYYDRLKELGIKFQCNFSSIIGLYGKDEEKMIKYLLKKKYVDYFGTDVHRSYSKLFDYFKIIEKELIKHCGNTYYKEIIRNGDKLVKNDI